MARTYVYIYIYIFCVYGSDRYCTDSSANNEQLQHERLYYTSYDMMRKMTKIIINHVISIIFFVCY